MTRAVVAVLAVAVLPSLGHAQGGPYLAVVSDPEVRLRAGPSDQYPETGTLVRGTRVVVARDESNGWVAVDAPQGQVSWVPTQFIDGYDPGRPTPQRVVVAADGDVTLAAGQVGVPQPLDVRKVKVPNGAILTVTGPKVTFDGKSWYPVAPPTGDFRYVPKSAVRFDAATNTSFVVRDTAPLPPSPTGNNPGLTVGARPEQGTIQPVSVAPVPAAKPVVSHPLWAQAEVAEQAGKYDDAEKLFFELARVMNAPGGDHDIANMCYSRIHTLREKKRGRSNPNPNPVVNTPTNPEWSTPRDDRTGLLPPNATPITLPKNTPAVNPNPNPTTGTDDKPRWTGPGVLTRSALALDGRRTYALESSPGVVKVYVVAAQGVDLDKFVNRRVDVHGVSSTRRDLSRPYVVATAAELVNP